MNSRKYIGLALVGVMSLSSVVYAKSTSLVGSWQGEIAVSASNQMALVFHFKQSDKGYQASFDVPAQKQFNIAFDHVEIKENKVTLGLSLAKMTYQGELVDQKLVGTYQQGAFNAPLVLSPSKTKVSRTVRKQEPVGALPYKTEAVSFTLKNGQHQLSGELSTPNTGVKAVAILLSGSGPTNRDADIAGHKWFKVLSHQLTEQGIAVLRFDDRGVGESTGDFASATSADFAEDAKAALSYLRTRDEFTEIKIGFIGHSEGGLIGAIAGVGNTELDFFVSLAGPGTSGAEVLIDQSYLVQKLMGMDKESLARSDKAQRAIMYSVFNGTNKTSLTKLMVSHGMQEANAKAKAEQVLSPWFEYFVKSNATDYLSELTVPVLALNGAKDVQIIAKQNIDGFKGAVKRDLLTTKVYPNLNHLFQPATTGLPSEYGDIEITVSEQVSHDIAEWLTSI